MKIRRAWFWAGLAVVVTAEVVFLVLALREDNSAIYFYGTTIVLVVLLGALVIPDKLKKGEGK
jgi:bacteriorhodopsin